MIFSSFMTVGRNVIERLEDQENNKHTDYQINDKKVLLTSVLFVFFLDIFLIIIIRGQLQNYHETINYEYRVPILLNSQCL